MLMARGRTPDAKEVESVQRKVNLVLGVSGQNDEQINVLVHALAKLSATHRLEMASVVAALCESYLLYVEMMVREQEGDDDE
jgi:mannitol/fructose-specific phosphotransferase system IIA component